MRDLLTGLGIALVFEGLLWAIAPDAARRMLSELASQANTRIQPVALIVVAAGVALVWFARG